jgi:hypothetical protein
MTASFHTLYNQLPYFSALYSLRHLTASLNRVAQSVQQLAMGWTAEEWGFDSRQKKEICLFSTASRPGSGAHPASYTMGTWGCFTWGKVAGA